MKTKVKKSEKNVIEATELIGRNSRYIRQALKDLMINAWGTTMMVRPLQSKKDEKGRTIATTRLLHYANTALIAYKIANGLFPNDKDFCMGVSTVALLHDLGQGPFGHDGESALTYASKENNGGPRLHNIDGAMKILYRYSDRIKYAINAGRIIENEARLRNIDKEELEIRLKNGSEPSLNEKIKNEIIKNSNLPDEAVKILAIAAGNHNGERGIAHIKPKTNRTFEKFLETAEKTYIDASEDKNMESCNIVDAIVKISDQISSITLDIIDAKRAGIEDEIYEGWAEPISQVLQISEEEARKKLKGNDKELRILARNLQEKFIDSVIRSSNQQEIKMDLEELLYGATDEKGQLIKNGLRTFNLTEHTAYTSTAEMEVLLNNAMSEVTTKLSRAILDENNVFFPDLNEIFRIPANNSIRKTKENLLISNFDGNDDTKEFYEYVIRLSPEEYRLNKRMVKRAEVQYYREKIERALKRRKNIINRIEIRSPRKSTDYLIEEYILSPNYEAMIPNEKNEYSDDEIKNMIDRINAFLNANPIEGIQHLSLLVQKHKYQIGIEGESEKVETVKSKMNTDQQIAARLAVSYLNTLNDKKFVDLALQLGVLSQEEYNKFFEPYKKKTKGDTGYKTETMKKTQQAYEEGSSHAGSREH